MNIGSNIKRIRKEQGLTQKELGERLGGISQQQIGQWETGKANPKIETIKKIAQALDVSLFEFLDDELFDAATVLDTEHEKQLINNRLKAITENKDLSSKEKEILLQDFMLETEILANIHVNNAETSGRFILNEYFNQLNLDGQEKAIEHVEMLTKIPEYQKK